MLSKHHFKFSYSKLGILLSGLVCVLFFFFFRWQDRQYPNWLSTIESDGTGYYVYLPSAILYQDVNHSYLYEEELTTRYKKRLYIAVDTHPNGKKYSKCYMGASFLMLPFFLIGIVLAWLFSFPIDGYSIPFQLMVFLAALSYMLAGLSLISRVLRKLNISDLAIGATLVSIALGTNLLNYTWFEASFTHAYEFFMVSVLLFWGQRYFAQPTKGLLLGLFFLLGLMIITRPTTAMAVIGLGVVIETKEDFIKGILFPFQHIAFTLLSFSILIAFIALQLFTIYWQVGTWEIWTYQGESFNFLDPHFFEFLFGYEKGLFVYSPVLIFSILGGVFIWREHKSKSIFLFILFLLVTYVLSSWWAWAFGAGFGSRAFIDYYPILAIPMAFLFDKLRHWFSVTMGFLIVISMVLLSLTYHYQYRYNIIAMSGMDGPKFWQVFLETDSFYRWCTTDKASFMDVIDAEKSVYYSCDFESDCNSNFKNKVPEISPIVARDVGHCKMIDNSNLYGALFTLIADSSMITGNSVLLTYDADVKITNKTSEAVVAFNIHHKKDTWRGEKMITQIRSANTWQKGHFEFELKDLVLPGDTMSLYVLNNSETPIWVDNIRVGVHVLKN